MWKAAARKRTRRYRARTIEELCAGGKSRHFWNLFNGHRITRRGPTYFTSWTNADNKNYLNLLRNYIPVSNSFVYPALSHYPDNVAPFSYKDFLSVLHSKKKPSTAGCDGIKFDMVRALSDQSRLALLQSIILLWTTNTRGKSHYVINSLSLIALNSMRLKITNFMVEERFVAFLNAASFFCISKTKVDQHVH